MDVFKTPHLKPKEKETLIKTSINQALLTPQLQNTDPTNHLTIAWHYAKENLLKTLAQNDPIKIGAMQAHLQDLPLGPTPTKETVAPSSILLASILGAVLGKLLISALLQTLGATPEWATFLGTATGATLITYLASQYTDQMRKWLQISAAATAGLSLLAFLLRPAAKKSILTYLSIPLILLLASFFKKNKTIDQNQTKAQLTLALQSTLLQLQTTPHDLAKPIPPQTRDHIETLIPSLMALKNSSAQDLPTSAKALLIQASNLGYKGLDGIPRFINGHTPQKELTWSNQTKQHYDAFGHYEEGQKVIVEQEPIITDSKLIKKGLVRKA